MKKKFIFLVGIMLIGGLIIFGLKEGYFTVINHLNLESASKSRFSHVEGDINEVIKEKNDKRFIHIVRPINTQSQSLIDTWISRIKENFIAQSEDSKYISTLRVDYELTQEGYLFQVDKRINNLFTSWQVSLPFQEQYDSISLSNQPYLIEFNRHILQSQLEEKVIIDESEIDLIRKEVTPIKGKFVALTFNESPSSYRDQELLKILDDYHAKATFFVLGSSIEGQESLLKSIVDKGHQLGTLGYDFSTFTQLSCDEIQKQIDLTNQLISDIVDTSVEVIRAPYGLVNQEVLDCVNMPFINWSVDSLDWKYDLSSDISDMIVKETKHGSIILFSSGSTSTVKAVQNALSRLQAQGYQFVTVNELFYYSNKYLIRHRVFSDIWSR